MQWHGLAGHRSTWSMGRGINRQIRRAYGFLASRYRPGDRIFLFGYSRGAYAVRSLAGMIDRVGLLKAAARDRAQRAPDLSPLPVRPRRPRRAPFRGALCHDEAPIEMVGVWDTVKALGLRLPLLWRLTEQQHGFHNHGLGRAIRRGYHALALRRDARRLRAGALDLPARLGRAEVEQVWFRGNHGDVGGQLGGFGAARPLANIPLVWMLGKPEACGVALPDGWRPASPATRTRRRSGHGGDGQAFPAACAAQRRH